VEKFKACLDGGRYTAEIRKEMAAGLLSGVNATPTFFLGDSGVSPDRMKPRKMLSGALDFSTFKTLIDELATKQAKKD
jgi:protein-disulfide isomerase